MTDGSVKLNPYWISWILNFTERFYLPSIHFNSQKSNTNFPEPSYFITKDAFRQ